MRVKIIGQRSNDPHNLTIGDVYDVLTPCYLIDNSEQTMVYPDECEIIEE